MPGMAPKEVILDTAQRAGILSPPASAETKSAPEQTRAIRPVGIATPPAAPPAPQAAQAAQADQQPAVQQPAAPQAAAAENEFLTRLKADLDQSQENPGASRQGILTNFLAQHGLTAEERADRTKYQEALRARHAALSDPEELRREKLKQTLLGMAGASNAGIALARGAAAGQNYEAGRNAEGLKVLEQLQGLNEGETAARRKALETAYGLGGREAESVRSAVSGMDQTRVGALARLASTDAEIKAREKEAAARIKAELERTGLDNASRERIAAATNQMHREVEQMRGQFHNQAASISAAASDRSSASNRDVALLKLIEDNSARLTDSMAKVEGEIERGFAPRYKAIENRVVLAGNKITPEIQKEIEKIDADKALAKKSAQNIIQNQLDQLGLNRYVKLGGGATSGGVSSGGFKFLGARPQ
jgi:hypothetical protein